MTERETVVTESRPRTRMAGPQRRRCIIEATIDVIAQHGIQGATTARIARASGVSEKTLYSYFSSRRHLLIATLDAVFERATRILREPQHPDPVEHLRIAARLHWPSEGEFVHPLFEFFASSPQEELRRELKTRHQAHVELVAGIVERGKAQGVVLPEIDSEQVAWEYYSVYWAEDIAYMLGFDDFGPSGRSHVMIDRLLRDISVSSDRSRANQKEGT